mmetsp:Transcript_23893/g.49344  ORF Transcript_23893/g.49344 Transcript_23893/m.49344 type:complete len:276 (-) Transcript_23893:986-1813(-)
MERETIPLSSTSFQPMSTSSSTESTGDASPGIMALSSSCSSTVRIMDARSDMPSNVTLLLRRSTTRSDVLWHRGRASASRPESPMHLSARLSSVSVPSFCSRDWHMSSIFCGLKCIASDGTRSCKLDGSSPLSLYETKSELPYDPLRLVGNASSPFVSRSCLPTLSTPSSKLMTGCSPSIGGKGAGATLFLPLGPPGPCRSVYDMNMLFRFMSGGPPAPPAGPAIDGRPPCSMAGGRGRCVFLIKTATGRGSADTSSSIVSCSASLRRLSRMSSC